MATTKIWDVKAHVSKLLAYVANKNKTTMELEVKSDNEAENLAAEILSDYRPSISYTRKRNSSRASTVHPRMPTKLC